MSDAVTFHCFPPCCVTQWSATLFLTSLGPSRRRQASRWSLHTIHSVGVWVGGVGGGHGRVKPFVFWFWSITFHLWSLTLRQAASQGSWERHHRPGYWHAKLLWTTASVILHIAAVTLLRTLMRPVFEIVSMCSPVIRFRCCKNDVFVVFSSFFFDHGAVTAPLSPSPSGAEEKTWGFWCQRKHSLKWHQVSHPAQMLYLGMPGTLRKYTLFGLLDPISLCLICALC